MIESILLDNYRLNILYCKVLSSALPSIKNKTSCAADNITYKANYLMFIGTVLNSVGLIFIKMQYIQTLNITGYLHFKVIYYSTTLLFVECMTYYTIVLLLKTSLITYIYRTIN